MADNRAVLLTAHFNSHINEELRPILTSLNGDNSWLWSFPRPTSERQQSSKSFFHVVHDPWLNGPTYLASPRILGITLPEPAAVTTGADIEKVVEEIEVAAAAAKGTSYNGASSGASPIDAILMNTHGIDHVHKPTLLTFNPSIPVFAAPKAASEIDAWKHFEKVVTNKDIVHGDGNWQVLHPGAPLPDWLTFFRLNGPHFLHLGTAIVISNPDTPGDHEAIVYTPHGISIEDPSIRTYLDEANPKPKTLALLHGLKESSSLGWKNTFGVEYGLKFYREARPKYWVPSHNAALQYVGLISYTISESMRTLEWGLENQEDHPDGKLRKDDVNLVNVRNGEFVVLS